MEHDDIFLNLNKQYSGDGQGESSDITPTGLTLGVVVDTDDPLQTGRLRVFCPALNDNPKKIHHLPWAIYISPFGGSIKNKGFTRGSDPSNCTTEGAVQYGFWAIPEQGSHVLVGCLDGDTRRRFWLGSAPEHQETHGILTGRWKWNGGKGLPDGPLSSDGSPIQPLAANLKKAFNPNVDGTDNHGNSSREWRTRAADYQVCAVREDVGEPPNTSKPQYLDEQYDKIQQAEPDPWVKPIVGAHGYDWSGYKSLGSFMASRVYGMSTPGFHSFIMDDRAFNSRIKIRSSAGHQILLDDTNERIYINTYEGNSWLEMDRSGNIDVYAKKRLSFHAEQDINFTTEGTFRTWAKKGIHFYSGNNQNQENLPNPPEDGEIRIQAEADIHVITKKNYRHLSFLDTLWEVGGKVCETIGDSLYLQVQNEIDIITNTGDYNLTVSGNLNEMVQGDANKFANGTLKQAATGNVQQFSFYGKMDVGAELGMNLKSMSSDLTLEAVGQNSGNTGGVYTKAPQSQHAVTSSGISNLTNKTIKNQAHNTITSQSGVPVTQKPNYPLGNYNIGDCNIGDTVPTDGLSGAALAAAYAYNAGFRGDALVTAVAVAGAESGYNQGAEGDKGLTSNKWGTSQGLWQVRTLKDPGAYSGIDTQRDGSIIGCPDCGQNNANFAYQLSKGGTNFTQWGAFTNGSYQSQIPGALSVVQAMCNPGSTPAPQLQQMTFENTFALSSGLTTIIEDCLLSNILAQGNLLVLGPTGQGISMQALTDIAIKGLEANFSTKLIGGVIQKLEQLVLSHNLSTFITGTFFAAVATIGPEAAAAIAIADMIINGFNLLSSLVSGGPLGILETIAVDFLESLGLTFLMESVCSYKLPFFDTPAMDIFIEANHDLNNGTVIFDY